jgi:hypothetical protein
MTYQAQIILNKKLISSRHSQSKAQLIAWLLTQLETKDLQEATGAINKVTTPDVQQVYTASNPHFD